MPLTPDHHLLGWVQRATRVSNNGKNVDGRVLPRVLLDDGQGKSTLDMDISSSESEEGQRMDGRLKSATMGPPGHANAIGEEHILLRPPVIKATGNIAMGATTPQLRKQNKFHRTNTLLYQQKSSQWTVHNGQTLLPEDHWDICPNTAETREMAPQGLTLRHEASELLAEWAQLGCPTRTGRDWSLAEIQAAIDWGSHQSAQEPDAIGHFAEEVPSKVNRGQARVVLWDDIKSNHPRQLKVSPVAAIPHKSRAYRLILDLSFKLCLEDGGVVESVNDTTEKWAPRGAIDQLGHSLKWLIHAFAEADDDAVILLAKWDIQDGFWRLNFREGEEWNFCYVWPQALGKPRCLVVPTSLQMGWVESPPYFCAASETARDVAVAYIKTTVGGLPVHKFEQWAGADRSTINETHPVGPLRYMLKVYVDDFISAIIPTSREQIEHVTWGILHGIHDVFPPSRDDERDPISLKKLKKGNGTYDTTKCLLSFDFDGVTKTMWLEESKRAALLTILHQ